jgi:fumarate reductase flavoprotein subunit
VDSPDASKKEYATAHEAIIALAALINVNATNLEASFAAGAHLGDMFGPGVILSATAETFSATTYTPSSIGSMGGLKININAEVLKVAAGQNAGAGFADFAKIPGLYAAGESANGDFFYLEYPGSGSSLAISATMGRTAGVKALDYIAELSN